MGKKKKAAVTEINLVGDLLDKCSLLETEVPCYLIYIAH